MPRPHLRDLVPFAVLVLGACAPLVEPAPTAPASAIIAATPSTPSTSPTAPTDDASPAPTPPLVTPGRHRPIGPGYRVQVPRLGIDLPMAEGDFARDRENTPINVALHAPGSAHPGEAGNTYLYAHARVGMFLRLWEARPGDEVRVLGPDGRVLRYAIEEVHPRVPPDDVNFLWNTSDERLTLQTSTGRLSSDPRFIVVARPR